MNYRIKMVREDAKMSMRAFASKIGLSSATSIVKLESGENNPSEQTIRAICSEFGINRVWLETGTGPMKIEPENIDELLGDRLRNANPFVKAFAQVLCSKTDDELAVIVRMLEELHQAVEDMKKESE